MPYMTATGLRIQYPTAIAAQLLRVAPSEAHDSVAELVEETRKIFEELQRVSAKCGELEAEVSRLKHENEFLTRFLAERMPREEI